MPKREQGALDHRYKVIPRSLIFITQGERVLLIKGAPHKRLWSNRYNGLGGHIEYGEDIYTSAERELSEESGLVGVRLWLCGVILVDASQDTGIGIFVFKGQYNGSKIKGSKEGKLEWVPADKIMEYPLVEDLYELIPRVMKHSLGEAPFAGRYFYDENDQLQIQFFGE